MNLVLRFARPFGQRELILRQKRGLAACEIGAFLAPFRVAPPSIKNGSRFLPGSHGWFSLNFFRIGTVLSGALATGMAPGDAGQNRGAWLGYPQERNDLVVPTREGSKTSLPSQ